MHRQIDRCAYAHTGFFTTPVAEELDCDWSKVTTEYPTPGQNVARSRVWGDFQTAGSRAIRGSHDYVRKGGAAARQMLIQAAANEWKVPVAECAAADGVIMHKGSGRTTTYGKVAEAASKLDPPKDGVLMMEAVAKTYRYLDEEEVAKQRKSTKGAAAKKAGGK